MSTFSAAISKRRPGEGTEKQRGSICNSQPANLGSNLASALTKVFKLIFNHSSKREWERSKVVSIKRAERQELALDCGKSFCPNPSKKLQGFGLHSSSPFIQRQEKDSIDRFLSLSFFLSDEEKKKTLFALRLSSELSFCCNQRKTWCGKKRN